MRLTDRLWAARLFCLLAAGCTSTEEATYSLQIVGPPDAFVGASSVALYLRDAEVARTSVNAMGAFTLEVSGLNPDDNEGMAVFVVRGLDAQGGLVAYGETPVVEMRPATQDLKIFVQKPGTMARSTDFPVKLRNQTVVAAVTQPTISVSRRITAPVFAYGETVDKQFSRELYIYNPLSHAVEKVADLPQARSQAPGFARLDGAIFVFGGFLLPAATPNPASTPDLKASQQLDLLVVGRENFKKFSLPEEAPPLMTSDPATARAGAVVAASGARQLLLGGFDDYDTPTPLNTVAIFEDVGMRSYQVRVHNPMMVARAGHTATTDPTVVPGGLQGTVLVFGGAPVGGGPVAELLENDGTFTAVALGKPNEPPGPDTTNRRFHQAVVLPTKGPGGALQVVITGGLDDAGNPRADSVECFPAMRTCTPGRLTLQTPRSHFAAFVLNNDLVVTGGMGPGNVPVATTEIYDARSLAFVRAVPSVARSGVTATILDNLSAVISGGEIGADVATAIEIYQPRRAQ